MKPPFRIPFLRVGWRRLILLALILAASLAEVAASDWETIRVPGSWESNGPPAARAYDGFAWYRTWVKPAESFFSRHERNLFEESITINIQDLADAYEIFVNGKSIGIAGRFPPNFESGRSQIHRHKVPVGTLRKGEWNEIALRVFNRSGPGGFLGQAPFIMDYFQECVLEGPWQIRFGDDARWAGAALTDKPAPSAFDRFHESNRTLGEAAESVTGERLTPSESLAKMQPADDLAVEQLLAEPLVTQPVHLSFDERGRLWIAQYRQYPYPAGLKMVSRDKYYRAHYDKVPPPPPNHDRGRDVISIHEDADGDGQFDRHRVFLDGLNLANAALRGRGGVWVMHTPYLLFYPDKNFDDTPDGPPEVHLQGFNFEDTHSVANGLVWGMDGWLYGAQGSTTSSRVTRPGIDPPGSPGIAFQGCMVWRYHPETRAYEIFAEGSGNTFGLEVDAQGRLFSGHNGGTTRGWHYLQGGLYLKQGFDPGKFGPPRNPYTFGQLAMMKSDSTIPRFSHFAAVAEGSALPWKYTGMFFSLDPLHNIVIASERRVLGATFETSDKGSVLSCSDAAFRPVHIANAPDGSLFIADFYEYYIAHGQHYQNQIDRSTGRIYRLRGKDRPLERETNLEMKTTDALIALLAHPNKWHRHTAIRLLGERKDQAAGPKLKRLVAQEKGLAALGALWALHQAFGLDEATVLQALRHSYAPVRMWAVRLAGDRWGAHPELGLPGKPNDAESRVPGKAASLSTESAGILAGEFRSGGRTQPRLPDGLFESLLERASAEPDAEVRSQLAATARRLAARQAVPLVAKLLEHDEDLNDPCVPLMSWWALEAHASKDRDEILAMLKPSAIWDRPLVFEHILPRLMRRYALEGRRQDLLTCAQLLRLAPSPRHAAQLLKGFEEAFRGRSIAGLPDELAAALDAANQSSLIVRIRRGDAAAVAEALAIVADSKAKLDDRLGHTRAFGEVQRSGVIPVLLAVAAAADAPATLRKAALAALGAYEDKRIGAEVAASLSEMTGEVRTAALALMASRAAWSLNLLEAIRAGQIKPGSVPQDVVTRLRSHNEDSVSELAARLFLNEASPGTAEWQARIAAVEAALKRGSGNPYAGEAIFMDRCAGCHRLFFKGGNAGPDLTHYQRDNLGTMLASILNPNAEIREGFEYYLVETKDGRSLSGFLADRDNQVTVLRGLEGEDITMRAAEIRNIQPMGRSLMPEGLLNDLDEAQLRDLFAYLRLSQPITR